jgi:hypothetical protein
MCSLKDYVNKLHAFRLSPKFSNVQSSASVIYANFSINLFPLKSGEITSQGIYFEIEVLNLPDLVSLCVVDFNGGGKTSVSFNADTGSIIRETKKCADRYNGFDYIEGLYTTVMTPCPDFGRSRTNRASLALYITRLGELSFDRKKGLHWESTGNVCNCSDWVTGDSVVTPCVALGRAGEYSINITKVDIMPPLHIRTLNDRVDKPDAPSWNPWFWSTGDDNNDGLDEDEPWGIQETT